MNFARYKACASTFLAVLLLTLSVISRAPQSKCRCHEKRGAPASSQKQAGKEKPCVFGQLRTLTSSYLLPASLDRPPELEVGNLIHVHLPDIGGQINFSRPDRACARGPPALRYQ